MPHTRTQTPHNPAAIPSIRLISATPSTAGCSSEGSTSFEFNRSLEDAWAAVAAAPSALAPKPVNGAEEAPRKKLVPKKSKLSLLSNLATSGRERERARDFSDVVRRVGADCSAKGGFEIYVDPEVGEDIGEIVVVKKKKSRAALDGMTWGAKEVTNIPKVAPVAKEPKDKGLLKVKVEEGQKWWSIGRGRKDSKEKEKENKISHKPIEYIHNPHPRSKTPEPFKPSDTRARFNSLDSGALLNGATTRPVKFDEPSPTFEAATLSRSMTPTLTRSLTPTLVRSATPTSGGLLAPPGQAAGGAPGTQGSIALRAMRSVRSLARIGSWAQLKNMPAPGTESADSEQAPPVKEKEKKGTIKEKKEKKSSKTKENASANEDGTKKKKKSVKKDKSDKASEKEKVQGTLRLSTSSFEAGALTSSPGPAPASLGAAHTLGQKKRSILGLGLPSSMRLPSLGGGRVGSSASSINIGTISGPQRLSADYASGRASTTSFGSAHAHQVIIAGAQGQERRGSIVSSAGSSLRPMSTSSAGSGRPSSRSSGGSVRWDEEGLETVRERRSAERAAAARLSKEEASGSGSDGQQKEERRVSRESSRHSAEGRRRTSLKAVFPEVALGDGAEMEVRERRVSYPIVTIEEATVDGHGGCDEEEMLGSEEGGCTPYGSVEGDDSELLPGQSKETEVVAATPVKKARARPLSEQMLGKSRPKPMYEDEEGVLSILDAATNDLALLINNLDLQATPSTPGDLTPLRPSDFTPTASAAASPTDGKTLTKSQAQTLSRRAAATESPLKSAKKMASQLATMSSVSSLRPYAQSRGYSKPSPIGMGAGGLLPAAPIVSASATVGRSAVAAKSASGNAQNAAMIAQQIAPWAKLVQGLSPVKEKVRAINARSSPSPAHPTGSLSASISSMGSSTATFRPGHKRTMTPAPEPEPELVFQPLRPARSRQAVAKGPATVEELTENFTKDTQDDDYMHLDDLEPRQSTFGRAASGSLTPVFKRIQEDEQLRDSKKARGGLLDPAESRRSSRGSRLSTGSHLSMQSRRSSKGSAGSRTERTAPLARSARCVLGMSGTMGGSDVSMYRDGLELDASDPDSDVPDELRVILAHSDVEDTRSSFGVGPMEMEQVGADEQMDVDYPAPPPSSAPPQIPLPTFNFHTTRAGSPSASPTTTHSDFFENEDNTKASFDWTGELNALNESGASDRRSFVEQLEHAFKTPAKVDLRYDFGVQTLRVPAMPIPPVPRLPATVARQGQGDVDVEVKEAKAKVTEDWRMVVEAETSTSSMGEDDREEFEYEYDSRALGGVLDSEEASSGMEMAGWESGERIADVGMPSMFERTGTASAAEGESRSKSRFDMFGESAERIADVKEPTMAGLDSLEGAQSSKDNSDSIFARSTSSRSEGELDTSFRFGGLPQSLRKETLKTADTADKDKPLTLSDIIPPPEHARRLSQSFESSGYDDSELLADIYEHLMNPLSARIAATAAGKAPAAQAVANDRETKRRSIYKAPSRPTSGISFTGLGDSFEEARRNFEFGNDRPAFYAPASQANTSSGYSRPTRRARHNKMESVMSFASVSSYGRTINSGSSDPFDFGMMPSVRERPSSENMSLMLSDFEDTFAFRRAGGDSYQHPGSIRFVGGRPRQRVESDASTFSFHASLPTGIRGHHRRRESNMSVASIAPPISLYNRSYPHAHGHRRNDSVVSASSVSQSYSYSRHGMSAYARHRRDMSDASMGSEFSAGYSYLGRPGVGDKMFGDRFERPGLGDKMFDTGADLGPLTSITASPPESAVRSSFAPSARDSGSYTLSEEGEEVPIERYDSMLAYDSIMDERRFEDSDSIFEKTGYEPHRDSIGSDELFGDYPGEKSVLDEAAKRLQAPVIHSRRWSADITGVFGSDNTGVISPSKIDEEDTMLSMLGGGHVPVRRQSILESPCPRVEKRKFSAVQGTRLFKGKDVDQYESPAKARIVEKPSLASASSFQFGSDRMIRAQHGLLERQSLEDSCLIADGEDLSGAYFSAPVFTRPVPTTRSRSSTCTTSSSGSGGDTPPLSSSTGGETPPLLHLSDVSSVSGGSQSSIDLSQINIALSNATSPISNLNRVRSRARARGVGHRRRYSNAHMSRSSVYETIEEDAELASSHNGSPAMSLLSKKDSPTTRQAVFVVESDTASFDGHSQPDESMWDDERGIVALRKYYALRDEAHETVSQSRRMWSDTPFSLYAIQSFEIPPNPASMRALLEHSVQTYGPLPSELRPRRVRSRTSSRASPYPQARASKATLSPEQSRSTKATLSPEAVRQKKSTIDSERTPVLQQKSLNKNITVAPLLEAIKPFSPLAMDIEPKRENAFGLAPNARPRVPSNARRTALGWSKRSSGKSSTDQKENQVATGTVMTPGDNLRLNRPRPRGRPTPGGRTPAAQNRSIRI